jgi:oxygen-independent coproporphyrinogen-3 oxidase
MNQEDPPLAVYLHWPYCARVCPYCDFAVVKDRGRLDEQAALVEALAADLTAQAALTGPRRLSSIYLGGGTPSLMDPEAAGRLIDLAGSLWAAEPDLEVTLEANPTDAETGRLRAFAEAGVNRLSLGVQALDDASLAFLGRNHGAEEARRAARLATATFPRVSLDLIYALPGQTREAWTATLREAVDFGAEHISPYQLTIEERTAFGRAARRGTLVPASEDAGADLYETTQAVLEGLGFDAYEVSNHAKDEAARSRHNLAYWRGWDYAGAGPGAHGRLTLQGERTATEAPRTIEAYLRQVRDTGLGWAQRETFDSETAAEERLLMGIRSVEGVGWAEVAGLGLTPTHPRVIELAEAGLIEAGDRLTATSKGRPILDWVTKRLILQ